MQELRLGLRLKDNKSSEAPWSSTPALRRFRSLLCLYFLTVEVALKHLRVAREKGDEWLQGEPSRVDLELRSALQSLQKMKVLEAKDLGQVSEASKSFKWKAEQILQLTHELNDAKQEELHSDLAVARAEALPFRMKNSFPKKFLRILKNSYEFLRTYVA